MLCHLKTAVRLKELSPKASRSTSRGSVADLASFMAKLGADTLLDFATHRSQNETQSQKKHSCKNNACSQCSVTWQTDAIGLQ
jgi:hypothetical protein